MTNRSKVILGVLMIMMAVSVLTGCGGYKVDEVNSPRLEKVEINSYNQGSEDSQFVEVDLIFDRGILVADDKCSNLRITIADERIREDNYVLAAGENEKTATIKISVTAVTKGILKIQKLDAEKAVSEIQSADGKYAAYDFDIEAMIPSGVTLSTLSQEDGKVVKRVDTYWNIRSIAWVGLTENGNLVPVSETRFLEMQDGYAAVHGHEFLIEDQEDIAEKIAETLKNNYGSEYDISCSDDTVSVTKTGSYSRLDIDIYKYTKIN